MKLSPLLLGVSLALNAALVAAFFVGGSGSASTNTSTAAQPSPTTSAGAKDPRLEPTSETWAALKEGDIDQQVARLREAGFPPSVVRAIISAQINASYASRMKALTDAASSADQPPWKANARGSQTLVAQLALSREIQAALRAALGPDAENGTAATLRREHPYLPADKIDQIVAIRDRFNQTQTEMLVGVSGSITRAESDRIQALDRTMREEIAAVLSPQELEEYNLRASTAASLLRSRMEVFDATEAEYRALHHIESAYYDLSRSFSGQLSPEQQAQLRQAATQRDESIKALFTPERLAEYQRAGDSNYQQTTRLVSRLNLPPTTANDDPAGMRKLTSISVFALAVG